MWSFSRPAATEKNVTMSTSIGLKKSHLNRLFWFTVGMQHRTTLIAHFVLGKSDFGPKILIKCKN